MNKQYDINQQIADVTRTIDYQASLLIDMRLSNEHLNKMIDEQRQISKNLNIRIDELSKHNEVLCELSNEQSYIINSCMAEVPVENITTHTPENLAERIGDIVNNQCSLYNGAEQLCNLLYTDNLDESIKVVRDMQDEHCIYRDALKMIRDGTEYAQDLADKVLGWQGAENLDPKELCEDNLSLKIELEHLWKEYQVVVKDYQKLEEDFDRLSSKE